MMLFNFYFSINQHLSNRACPCYLIANINNAKQVLSAFDTLFINDSLNIYLINMYFHCCFTCDCHPVTYILPILFWIHPTIKIKLKFSYFLKLFLQIEFFMINLIWKLYYDICKFCLKAKHVRNTLFCTNIFIIRRYKYFV